MAGVFPGALGLYEGDAWANKLNFVADRGFQGSGVDAGVLADDSRVGFLRRLSERRGQHYFVHYGICLTPGADTAGRDYREEVKNHIALSSGMPLPVAQFVLQGGLHRFDRRFPIEQQLEKLAGALLPLVARLSEAGIVCAIENHADFYVSDLVSLCQAVPGLTILLDTGNCFLIGERPDQIPDVAFPLISSTHLKDHWARPDPGELSFKLTGATLGEGHVGLGALFEKLCRLHPDPESIRMMVEWVPDPAKDARACLNESMAYLENLSQGHFRANPLHLSRKGEN